MAELAARQHGIVAGWQLKPLGYTKSKLKRRRQAGRLHRVHRGVYAVGHRRLTVHGRRMAAVLAYGPHALLSHQSAAALWNLRPAPAGPIHVSVPGRSKRSQNAIKVHNVIAIDDADRTTLDGIPVTSLPRTLLDYAGLSRPQELRLAVEAADRQGLLDGGALRELYARSRGRAGLKPLRAAIDQLSGPAPWTRSELERRFLALIRGGGVPEPQLNVMIDGLLVDFYWPRARVVVEVDGYSWHRSRRAFEEDRLRDTHLQLQGVAVLRITQRRIEQQPQDVLRVVRRCLDRSPNDGPSAAASDR